MSWVSIDRERCNDCGICVLRCTRCFARTDDGISVSADEESCNLCGHCISLCPTDALVHSQMNMDNFSAIDREIRFDTDDFVEFVRRRRSHRSFKNRQIPREELEKLVDLCRYAPTGSNRQTVEIAVIRDPERIKRLSDLTVDAFERMLDLLEQGGAGESEASERARRTYANLRSGRLLMAAREMGIDPIFYRAPAVMIFHAPVAATTSPKDDCVIAAQTVVLAAMTMGLESCYIGLFEIAARDSQAIRDELALPPGNRVCSVLILGYPRFKYLRTVDRKPMRVTWD